MAEYVIEHADNFEAAIQDSRGYFRQEKPANYNFGQLSNGWWMYVTLSQVTAKKLCKKLAQSLGLTDEDWGFESN